MEDNLNDIEIIDKYLSGELNDTEEQQFKERYARDADFKKEVEVYRKIYEGIEQAGEQDLKKKLDNYYNEFLQEDLVIEPAEDNVRSINWRKTLYVVSGIAASVCLFAVIYLYNKPADDNMNQQVGINKHDQAHTPADSGKVKQQHSNDAYAFTGQLRLPDTAIRKAVYPQALSYTFNKSVLTLYGDPLLGLLKLDVFKKGGQYYLVYDNATYILSTNTAIRPLTKNSFEIKDEGVSSTEKIQVQVAAIQTVVYRNPPVGVALVPGHSGNEYYFTKEKDRTMLMLRGGFTPDNCMLVSLAKNGATNWYVVSGPRVYAVAPATSTPTPLKELSGLSSSEVRLFNKRDPFTKTVLSFNK